MHKGDLSSQRSTFFAALATARCTSAITIGIPSQQCTTQLHLRSMEFQLIAKLAQLGRHRGVRCLDKFGQVSTAGEGSSTMACASGDQSCVVQARYHNEASLRHGIQSEIWYRRIICLIGRLSQLPKPLCQSGGKT